MSELHRYAAHFRPHASALVLATVLLGLSSALPAATVLLLRYAVDEVLSAGRRDALAAVCLGLALVAVARAALAVGRTALTKRVAWRVASDLRQDLHRQLLRVPHDSSVGSRLAALTHEVDEVQYGVSAAVTAIREPLTLIGLAATALWLAPGLAPWALLLLPPVALTAAISGRRVHQRATEAREARSELAGLAGDQLLATDEIAAAGAQEMEARHFSAADQRDLGARTRLEVERVVPSAATQAVVAAAASVLLWVGGNRVMDGQLLPGQFLGFAVALGLMHKPLSGLAEVWSLLQRSLAALSRVYAVLDQLPPADPANPVPLPRAPAGLEVVGLVAQWLPDTPVLRGLNLEVRPGEIVALTGPSGAGKSTLLAAIRGELPALQGQIRLGAVDLDRVRRADRARAIGWVSQRNRLLDRSIADNVRLGRAATDDAVREALRRSGASFVDQLPDGIESSVGERGERLSGGERQRVCIARALLDQPLVLLLDEATNQLDPEVERQILADLRRTATGCAILLIAHDPTTAALADRVLCLDLGEVVRERAAGPRVVA